MSRRKVPPIAEPGPFLDRELPALAPAKKRKNHPKIPPAMRKQVYERDHYTCRKCGTGDDLTCDHIIPISKGGKTVLRNLQTLCGECNRRKADTMPVPKAVSESGAFRQRLREEQKAKRRSDERTREALRALGLPAALAASLPSCRESTSR